MHYTSYVFIRMIFIRIICSDTDVGDINPPIFPVKIVPKREKHLCLWVSNQFCE